MALKHYHFEDITFHFCPQISYLGHRRTVMMGMVERKRRKGEKRKHLLPKHFLKKIVYFLLPPNNKLSHLNNRKYQIHCSYFVGNTPSDPRNCSQTTCV